MKIRTIIDYTDFKLNKHLTKGTDLIKEYKNANIELDEDRINLLLKGNKTSNFKPFIKIEEEIETADMKIDNAEKAVKPRKRVNKERRSEDGQ